MYTTVDEMRAANRAAGQFWFEPSTLAFFDSNILEPFYPVASGVYFVTSEQAPESGTRGRADYYRPAAMFSVRFIDASGEVETVGEFQEYGLLSDAITAAKTMQRTNRTPRELFANHDGTGF